MTLEIKVTFLAGTYHARREEWPPAPTRLYQALVAASHYGAHGRMHETERDAAFRWLEVQPPPVIVAGPSAYGCTNVASYVPDNDNRIGEPHKCTGAKSLATHVVAPNSSVLYRWRVNADDAKHADVIAAMASLVTQLGRTVDSVFVHGQILTDVPVERIAIGDDREVFFPRLIVGSAWSAPSAGYLHHCQQRYPRSVSAMPPDYTVTRQVDYRTSRAVEAPPIAVVEMLRPRSDRWLAFDPRNLRYAAGLVRHAMIRWTTEMRGVREYFDDDRISRLVCGHRDAQSPECATGGHFAVVPLPSLASHGKADGWIRRVAIVGHGIHATEDKELFAELVRGLHCRDLIDRDCVIGELRCLDKSQEARALSFFSGSGKRWRSVTPIVLTSYTRHGRSREKCLLRALQQQGIAATDIESVATYSGPLVPKTLAAREYRVQGYLSETERVHAEIIFRRTALSALVIGRGRFTGFGLGAFVN
jgi:CRISPR-associated protein Csb2